MALTELRAAGASMDDNLAANLLYGAAVCRLIHYRRPEPLPEALDIEGGGRVLEAALQHSPRCWNGEQVCLQGPPGS